MNKPARWTVELCNGEHTQVYATAHNGWRLLWLLFWWAFFHIIEGGNNWVMVRPFKQWQPNTPEQIQAYLTRI
jgi:hypothetical protein